MHGDVLVEKLAEDVKAKSHRFVLVDVARGAYPDVTLAPATTPADIADLGHPCTHRVHPPHRNRARAVQADRDALT